MKEIIHLKIRQRIQESPDSVTFVFDASDLIYKPGQFLTFILGSRKAQVRRAYSLSTAPVVDQYPAITVKRVENGVGSRTIIDQWQVGQTVDCLSPAGKFVLPEENVEEFVFVAAGSGIVPLLSLIKHELYVSNTSRIHLIYSNRTKKSTIAFDALKTLENSFAERFKITWFFSDSFDILKARIRPEWIEWYLKTQVQHKLQDIHLYCCGPEHYMYLVEVASFTSGLPKANFHVEIFFRESSSNSVDHMFKEGAFDVHILAKHQSYSFKVSGRQTILQRAIELSIPLPWSCAGGRCSTCMCRLTHGEVYMSRNEVLTDKELKQGYILTCTSFPNSGPLTLDFRD